MGSLKAGSDGNRRGSVEHRAHRRRGNAQLIRQLAERQLLLFPPDPKQLWRLPQSEQDPLTCNKGTIT